MERDIYQAPEADLETEEETGQPFYVVSRAKFLTLYLATLGIYGIYWFYRHWLVYRRYSGHKLWPIPRAIFAIFFAHALFRRFYEAARRVEPGLEWRHGLDATLFIIFALLSSLSDRLPALGIDIFTATAIGFGAFFIVAWLLTRAQRVANLASGDPGGKGNGQLGAANIVWILLGLVMWLMTLVGIAVLLGLPNPP